MRCDPPLCGVQIKLGPFRGTKLPRTNKNQRRELQCSLNDRMSLVASGDRVAQDLTDTLFASVCRLMLPATLESSEYLEELRRRQGSDRS